MSVLLAVHLACVATSLAGFVLRGWWMWRASPWLSRRPTRVLPHLVDSVLLVSGIALTWRSAQLPWQQPWLAAKLAALLLYIVLGSVALKRGRSRRQRGMALVAALLVFAYMVGAALRRSPLSWLAT